MVVCPGKGNKGIKSYSGRKEPLFTVTSTHRGNGSLSIK